MRSWLRRASQARVSHTPTVQAPILEPDFASDPLTWQEAFESHWIQADSLMLMGQRAVITQEHIIAVFKHMDQMILLLLTEVNAQPEPSIGHILNQFFTDDMLSKLVKWSLTAPPLFSATCQVNLLKLYEGIVTQCHSPHHCLLVHKPILLPLLRLLEWCQKSSEERAINFKYPGPSEVEKHFLLLLNQICTKMAEDSTLLEFFFNNQRHRSVSNLDPEPNENSTPRFLVFTLMIPYLYDPGDVGQLARDALLLILSVSRKVASVGMFISQDSNFCPVLATGLSGCFSQLPRRLVTVLNAADDWHRITVEDIEKLQALQEFYSALLFCNAVVQVGHPLILEQLLDFIYQGFLVSVVKPALYETGLEELIAATAYLDLCFRTVTEPSLLRVLIKFLLTEEENEKRLLETLIDRIATNTKLCIVSLALFDTLLDLNCEDFMLELLLKYLIPCTHVMASQVANVRDLDLYGKAANKFLSLTPRCCIMNNSWQSSGSESSLDPSGNVQNGNMDDLSDQRLSYLEYLSEAHDRVTRCHFATRCWAFAYDGESPDPNLFRDDPSPSGSEGSSNSEIRSRGFQRSNSIRRSGRLNQYFTRRHTSGLTAGHTTGLSATDMAILGSDWLNDDLDDDDLFNQPETSSPNGDSDGVTPRYRKAAPDYFKLAFDEDLESNGRTTSDSQEENDSPFVLRGWSHMQDLNAFIEVLDRVRPSQDSTKYTLEENLTFIDQWASGNPPIIEEDQLPALTESKDSGVDINNSMVASTVEQSPSVDQEMVDGDQSFIGALPPVILGVPIKFKSSFSNPYLGPFMNVLMQKLDNFVSNTLFLNLQLTGILSKLACYPQPLMVSLLLNPTLVFQPSIRSLFQILSTIKQRIDQHAFGVDNFESLLHRGWRFLHTRERRYASEKSSRATSNASKRSTASVAPVSALELQGFTAGEERFRSFSQMFAVQGKKETKPRADTTTAVEPVTKGYKFYHHKAKESQEATLEAMRTKNIVYCAIVLQEFLQELAAISQEHAVVSSEIKRIYS